MRMDISKHIARAQKSSGLDDTHMAAVMGLPIRTFYRWKTGQTKVHPAFVGILQAIEMGDFTKAEVVRKR